MGFTSLRRSDDGGERLVRTMVSFRDEGPKLYVCSTPIGNLGDVSERLLEILRTVDVIAAEDTRHTRKLLAKYDIHPPALWSYHEHNVNSRAHDLLNAWTSGRSVALVSDAGTPLVSDPGEQAVELAIEHDVPVIPVPGPSAVLAALVGSGFPVTPFTFVGFLPRTSKACRDALTQYGQLGWTFVFYEAPHRMEKTMRELVTLWPERHVVVARELTKRHETFLHGTAEEVLAEINEVGIRGEYVVVVSPVHLPMETTGDPSATSGEEAMAQAIAEVIRRVQTGESHRSAVRDVATALAVRRKDLYNATLQPTDNR